MSKQTKTILLRALRSFAAVLIASLAGWLAGPEAASIVPAGYQFIVTGLLIPTLLAVEKWFRYGGDPGEGGDTGAPGAPTD